MATQTIHVEKTSNSLSFEMIYVEGGKFMMGSDPIDSEAWNDEKPRHEVSVSSFFIGKFPVTQALWKEVMQVEKSPAYFQGDDRPVETVSWNEAQEFIQALNDKSGKNYRMPTEAEWEFAARGGKQSLNFKYAGSDKLKEVGWFEENSHRETKDVGLKLPNELGIYDMSGNVFEWVEDHWHDNYEGAPIDGSAWLEQDSGLHRVYRGGGWNNDPRYCRASVRFYQDPGHRLISLGFRLALPSESVG